MFRQCRYCDGSGRLVTFFGNKIICKYCSGKGRRKVKDLKDYQEWKEFKNKRLNAFKKYFERKKIEDET